MSTQALAPIEVPSYLAAYVANNSALAAVNDAAIGGLSAGMPPMIGLNGTRFVVKANGEETTLNQLELMCVVLKAKPGVDKQWFATKYVPGQETQSPDCYSLDGIRPEADSPNKQCESCAGCPQNQFGSATDNSGGSMAGKACQDNKVLALFANGNVYRFKIPAASLKGFAQYVKSLASQNLFLPAVITVIGFDPAASFPKLTFRAQGALAEAQFKAILGKLDSPEVNDALMVKPATPTLPAPVQQPAQPVAQPVAPAPPVDPAADLGLGAAPTPVETAPKQQKKQQKTPPAQQTVVETTATPVQPAADPLTGLGADPLTGLGAAPAAGPTAEDLSAALGL